MHVQDKAKRAHGLETFLKDLTVGVAVSFIAISLGASFGILSGRGAFAGMLSAGVIALVTSLFGGTRIQCSGPTAPMSAISAVVIGYAFSKYDAALTGDQFITLVFLMTSGFLLFGALLRLGRFIAFIPNVVVSGFMSGIALLIWKGQAGVLFGLNGADILEGSLLVNLMIAASTVILIFVGPVLFKKYCPRAAVYLPGTLLAIVIVSAGAFLLNPAVEYTSLDTQMATLADFGALIKAQWPDAATLSDFGKAMPFALELALLCYLDTLLTSLVIDRMTREKTHQNKELAAQGIANALAGLLGGIPGAQATIRSVLMIKENAATRLAGVFVGVFVLIEIFMFRDFFSLVPAAVFSGILIKVGYDVFDWMPLKIYARQLLGTIKTMRITHLEMLLIAGTMLVTLFVDLNAAVGGFTVLFYFINRTLARKNPVPDLKFMTETEGASDEP